MRLAFIGGWGHHYLRQLLGSAPPDVALDRPIAVASDTVDAPAAQRLGAALGEHRWFDDPLCMLDAFRPDAVSIGAVYAHNARWVRQCLQRGIPVVSDKPIAATWDDLRAVEAPALAAGAPPLVTEFDFRARPAVRAMRDAIAAGAIGQVALVTAQKSYRFGTRPPWYADRASYGGTLLWVASHGIDAIGFVTGLRPVAVTGHHANVTRPDYGTMEDHTATLFRLENGATAIVHADLLRPAAAATHADDRLRIVGSAGALEWRDQHVFLTTHDAPDRDITPPAAGEPLAWHLLAALRGAGDGAYGTAASLSTARLLLHARDAADQARWIPIQPGRI